MEFMSSGKPAVAPRNTAMIDYIDADNAFIVDSSEEATAWPHDPRAAYRTLRYITDWESLCRACLLYTSIDAVGQAVVDPRQARAHHLGEDHRVDDDHRQRIEHRPQRAEQRPAVARLELALDAAENEATIAPQGTRQAKKPVSYTHLLSTSLAPTAAAAACWAP